MNNLVQSFLAYRLVCLLKDDYVYNEFSLQHELGIYLRQNLPNNYRVLFERNVDDIFHKNGITVKKEMDIYIYNKSNVNEKYAIELKFPRNGAYPKRMFHFIEDIVFMEDVKNAGATKTYVLTLVEDKNFYNPTGHKTTNDIYDYFRSGKLIKRGTVFKQIGNNSGTMVVKKNHQINWNPVLYNGVPLKDYRYYFLEIN